MKSKFPEPLTETQSTLDPFQHWSMVAPHFAKFDTPPPPKSWEGWEARYENDCESGKRTTRKFGSIGAFGAVVDWLLSEPWLNLWRMLTGIPDLVPDKMMHGGGLHTTEAGGWLNCHIDYGRHPVLEGMERRLSVIMFLNREWREEWGGAFFLADPAGNVVRRYYPAPGRIVAFENSDISYHGTERLADDAPDRVTAAVFFLSPARAGVTRRRALFMPNRNAPTM